MKLRTFIAPILAISFSFTSPCSGPKKADGPREGDQIFTVQSVNPEFRSVPKAYSVEGTFAVSELTQVKAHVDATVEQVFVNEGDLVTEADPLVSLSSTQVLEQIDINRAKVKELNARLSLYGVRIDNAGGEDVPTTIEDTEFLDEDPIEEDPVQQKIGDTTVPTTKPNTLKALGDVVEAQVAKINKQTASLERKLLRMTLTSPATGVVTAVKVSDTNPVKEKDVLIELSQVDPMSVVFQLPEDVANFVDKNSKVKVSPVDAKEVKATGQVYFVDPSIDPVTKTLTVKAHVANKNGVIKGGQKAKVQVNTRKIDRVIVLPKTAIHEANGKNFVYVIYREKAKEMEVEVGDQLDDGMVLVYSSSLRVDDDIITDAPEELKHNSYVKKDQVN